MLRIAPWAWLLASVAASAANLDLIEVNRLRAFAPTLNGAGVMVAQPESIDPNTSGWQVSPAAVGQPVTRFAWHSSAGSSTNFPNTLGNESFHADGVASFFYGVGTGVATNVVHIDCYDADYFLNGIIADQTAIPAKVVNQSYALDNQDPSADLLFDKFAHQHGVLFVSGVGSGSPKSPSTCYHGIAVGADPGHAAVGPTPDGRCKPDLIAPGGASSFTTPYVSGSAALLVQAGTRGDGGAGTTTTATDIRILKTLLLNGASKPADWTNSPAHPLDFRYGAGVVNAYRAWCQLRGGQQAFSVSTTSTAGAPASPASTTNFVAARRGWDLNTISNERNQDRVNHYVFDLRSPVLRTFVLTATLTWHRQIGAVRSGLNDLDLLLLDASTGAVLAGSRSAVDNVEHLSMTNLPPGRYDLQVVKNGVSDKRYSSSETYALAFDFGPPENAVLADSQWRGGEFRLRLAGEPFASFAVEASPDFLQWLPLQTNRLPAPGSLDLTDRPAGETRRFYRARWLP